jgi:hypothetical protein
MTDKPYTAGYGHDNKYYVNGPAPGGECSYYGGTLYPSLRFDTVEEAERAAKLANIAFEQGKEALRCEIKALLQIN